MPGDSRKEIAAAGEPPGGRRGRLRLASHEFFFLLQRIDRLDEKLTGEAKAIAGDLKDLDERVNARIDRLDDKLSGEIKALDEKLTGEIRAQGERIDHLDEKLSGEIKAQGERIDRLDEKINALNEKINSKFGNLTLWMVGTLVTIIVGFVALLLR